MKRFLIATAAILAWWSFADAGKLHNLCSMSTTTTGTGTITLASASTGYNSFVSCGVTNAEVVTYAIQSGSAREIGRGTYTSAGTTLSRDTILGSTNAGAAISLTGTSTVFITPAAEDILPGGSDTQVQYNDAGSFGGDAGLTFAETTNVLTVTDGDIVVTSTTYGDQIVFDSNTQYPNISVKQTNDDSGFPNVAFYKSDAGDGTVEQYDTAGAFYSWTRGNSGQGISSGVTFKTDTLDIGGSGYNGGLISFQVRGSSTSVAGLSDALVIGNDLNIYTYGTVRPGTNDVGALGAAGGAYSDLFLAETGVINWDSGDATITQSGNDLTVSGATWNLWAGDASNEAMNIPSGTLMTTPVDGGIEADADAIYASTDAGNRGYIPVRHYIRSEATRTFTSNTSSQAIFTSPTNGRLTLETGLYKFEAVINMNTMSATSGNGVLDIKGAGTATASAYNWVACGSDAAAGVAVASGCSHHLTAASGANVLVAATGATMGLTVTGTVEVTGAGTFIPSFAQTTAAAAVVQIGSFFMFERIGSTTTVSVGQWD